MSNETQLNTFLLKCKNDLASFENYTSVNVVIGNESCDLDSAVSCITYAFYLFLAIPRNSLVIPVINVPRKHFEVKTEVKYFLNFNNITDDILIFRDDIDLKKLHDSKRLKLALVDHHVLQNDLQIFKDAVKDIIDHRPIDSLVFRSISSINIQLVGSCCTLVGLELKKRELLKDKQIATLIYGTVLLDTSNFSPLTKKTTPLDIEIVNHCETDGKIDLPRQELFDKLVSAKADTSLLSTDGLLIKDMKKVYEIPIPVLTMSVNDFLERPDAEKSIKQFSIDHNAQVLLILGVLITEGNQLRDLFIYPHSSQQMANQIEEYLRSSTNPKLDLHLVENKFGGKIFKEINTYTTRKQILPIVKKAVENYGKPVSP